MQVSTDTSPASVTIGASTLKLPIASPQRLLVLGDTGCRMSSGAQQNCHDPAGFPFAALANYEGQFNPDLIVQAGDYFYRDANCTLGGVEFVPGCNNPTNANYETWGLLASAPWVMTRGNHESCGRGARGWFALLDPHPFNINLVLCQGNVGLTTVAGSPVYTGDFTQSYVVPAGQVNLLVHDSSFANDSKVDANMAKNYDLDLTNLLANIPGNLSYFYVTHKPTYGLVAGAPMNGGDFTEQYTFSGNASANSAFVGGKVPAEISMFLSGHIHQFEYVNFNNNTDFAPQLIVGMGGDSHGPDRQPERGLGYFLTTSNSRSPCTAARPPPPPRRLCTRPIRRRNSGSRCCRSPPVVITRASTTSSPAGPGDARSR